MRNSIRSALAIAVSIGVFALTAAAGANATTITGGGTFTTNAGPSRTVAGSLAVLCTSTTTSTTIPSGTYTPPVPIGTSWLTFSGCNIQIPLTPVTVTCQPVGPAVVNLTGPPSPPAPSVIPWSVTNIDCTIAMTSRPTCKMRLVGESPTLYYNPGSFLGGPFGAFDFQIASQAFTAADASTVPCGLPPGPMPAKIGSPVGSGTGIADLQHVLTSLGPTIT